MMPFEGVESEFLSSDKGQALLRSICIPDWIFNQSRYSDSIQLIKDALLEDSKKEFTHVDIAPAIHKKKAFIASRIEASNHEFNKLQKILTSRAQLLQSRFKEAHEKFSASLVAINEGVETFQVRFQTFKSYKSLL